MSPKEQKKEKKKKSDIFVHAAGVKQFPSAKHVCMEANFAGPFSAVYYDIYITRT